MSDNPKITRPARPRLELSRTGQRPLPVSRHHRQPPRAAGGWVAHTPRMFAEQSPAPALIGSRPIGPGFGKHLDPVARGVDGHQTEADQSAEAVHTPISITTPSSRGDGEPYFIRRSHVVDRLQQQLEAEPKFHFYDGNMQRLAIAHGENIAAMDLAFDAETRSLKEAFYGRIQRGFGHAAQDAIPARVVTIPLFGSMGRQSYEKAQRRVRAIPNVPARTNGRAKAGSGSPCCCRAQGGSRSTAAHIVSA
jgi:hypothetical protein